MGASEEQILQAQGAIRGMICGKFAKIPPYWMSKDDMIQTAMMAVVRKAKVYDPEKSIWIKYALAVGYFAVLDELRTQKTGTRTRYVSVVSLNEIIHLNPEFEYEREDTLADESAPPMEDVFVMDDILRAMGLVLNSREHFVLALYMYEDMTLREIGSLLGVTESRVSQIKTRACTKLRNSSLLRGYECVA